MTVAAESAQEAHDLMLKLSEEVDRLRSKPDGSQAEVRRKEEAESSPKLHCKPPLLAFNS